jgi:hypothetical protein
MRTLNNSVLVLLIMSLAGCGQQLVEFGNPVAPSVPTVSSTDPANTATGVGVGRTVNATFSEQMDPATITAAIFTVKQGTASISGSVRYAGQTATFQPASDLTADTTYTASVSVGAKSSASGTGLAADYIWSFKTALGAPPAPPLIISTDPGDNSTGVVTSKQVSAVFSRAMDPTTLTGSTFTLKQGLNSIAGAVSYAGTTAKFVPTSLLAENTTYSATITTGAKDGAGIGIASNYNWTFATGSGPAVLSTDPINLATNVPTNKQQISAVFNKPMDPATITANTFTLKQGLTTIVATTVNYAGQTATFMLAPGSLQDNKTYSATITAGAKDMGGTAIAADFPWSFSTAAAPPPPLAINLRSAASFGLASRAGMTSTGKTVVNGDVALYPTPTCTDATGGPASSGQTCLVKTYATATGLTVNGSIFFFGDPFDNGGTANSVTNDLQIAWNEGKNKVPTMCGGVPCTAASNQLSSSLPYAPGIYHNPTLGLAGGGTATLDAGGDANAVFIFQDDASFVDSGTPGNPSRIVLINNAQARNVWFIIGSDFTTGSGTTWNGNVLVGGTVSINHGSTIVGRVLAGAAGAGALSLTGTSSDVTTVSVPQ